MLKDFKLKTYTNKRTILKIKAKDKDDIFDLSIGIYDLLYLNENMN